MKKNVRNKKYAIKEAVSYYILGYKRYEQNVNQNGLGDILKDIVEVAQSLLMNYILKISLIMPD